MPDQFTDPEDTTSAMPEEKPAGPPQGEGSLKAMSAKFKAGMAQLYDKEGKPKVEAPAEEKPAPAEAKTEAKPEAKTTTPPVADDLPESIKAKSPKTQEEFKNLRTKLMAEKALVEAEAKAVREEAAKIKAELETVKKTPTAKPEELQKIAQERDELMSRLEQVALEHSPQFQQKYSTAFDAIKASAQAAVGDKNKDIVLQILDQPPSEARKKQISALTEGLDQTDAVALAVAVMDMDRVRAERNRTLSNHKEALRQQQEQALAMQRYQQDQDAARKAAIKERTLAIAREQYEAFKADESVEAVARVKDYEADVEKAIMGRMTESEAAMLPVLAAQGQFVITHELPKAKARIAELEQQLAEVRASMPKVETGSSGDSRPTQKSGSRFIAAYKQAREQMP